MVKSYLIGLNIVGVVLISLLYTQDGVNFEYSNQVGVNINETKTITLTIDKGDATGAARLVLGLNRAKGVEATILNAGGGVPDKEEGNLIFRWENLPPEPVIEVTFEVRGLQYGTQIIDGEFSFMDGTRKTLHLPDKVIHVYPEKTPKLDCHRDIKETEKGMYEIELVIDPGSNTGFGGIKENIPEGYAAKILEANNATTKIDPGNGRIVFTWLELPPAGEKIKVKYALKEITPTESIYNIEGYFWAEYMIVDGKSVEYFIPTTGKAKELPTPQIDPPLTDVTYKVQIMAAHKVVGKEYFQRMHKFNTEFTVEAHEGWQKYIIGNFPEYQFARDKREELRGSTNLPKPFVTAYNKTKRITVQEALVLSNQKWVQ
ncbi:MAG: hypothetical protein KDC84_11335 [Crocinitomicaceae bacterium]|nr:hypothetical protein [Crocinitomicaceae bacterium]